MDSARPQFDLNALLARTTPSMRSRGAPTGCRVFLVDLRENLGHGVEIRPIER